MSHGATNADHAGASSARVFGDGLPPRSAGPGKYQRRCPWLPQGPQRECGVAVGGQELVADHGRAADDQQLPVLGRGVKAPTAAGAITHGAARVEETSVRADVTGRLGIGNSAPGLQGLLRAGNHPGLPDRAAEAGQCGQPRRHDDQPVRCGEQPAELFGGKEPALVIEQNG